MLNLSILFTLLMLPGLAVLAASLVVSFLKELNLSSYDFTIEAAASMRRDRFIDWPLHSL